MSLVIVTKPFECELLRLKAAASLVSPFKNVT